MPDPKPLCALLLCTLVAGCGARSSLIADTSSGASAHDAGTSFDSGPSPDSGRPGFPLGIFSSCAEGFQGPDGNTFLNTSGVMAGAVLTVTEDGPSIKVSFTDQNGLTNSLRFDPTSNASAVLQGGAGVTGFSGLCVQGPGDEGSFPAVVTAASGALAYDANTMFVSLEGTVTGGAGSPCGASSAPARVWIACGGETAGSSSSLGTGGEGATASFPTGKYACTSQVGMYIQANGMQDFATSGGTGTLVVTQAGATVTAGYTGDTSIAGTLELTVTSATTASAVSGETLSAPCTVPISITGPAPPDTPETLSVAGASLMLDDAALFLSFRGTMTSSCTGALATGSLICAKQ